MPIPPVDPSHADPSQSTWHDDWVVAFDPDRATGNRDDSSAAERSPVAVSGAGGSDLVAARSPAADVLFAGFLTNASELDPDPAHTPAPIVARLFSEQGVSSFGALRGYFAVIVWDRAARRLHVARDQVGLQPLFMARSEGRWHFAGAPQPLVALPGVSRAVDAVALSEWICGWYPSIEDTAYRDVKRVPPASVTTFDDSGISQRRYWDPSPI